MPVESPASGEAVFLHRSVAFAVFHLTLGFALNGPDLFLVLPADTSGMVLGLNLVLSVTMCVRITFFKMLIQLLSCWSMKYSLMLGKFLMWI